LKWTDDDDDDRRWRVPELMRVHVDWLRCYLSPSSGVGRSKGMVGQSWVGVIVFRGHDGGMCFGVSS
jgi:hypothetical protein